MNVFNADVVDELGEENAKVDSPTELLVNGSSRAFGCRLLVMTSLFEPGPIRFVRSCLDVGSGSGSSAGVSNDFSTTGALVLFILLYANDAILDTRRCSKLKRLSF